ncbi:MAG TPA: FAD-dependent oxidoreductase [Lacunisphaera sp.]|nr:FAD-dependent oxidoreductase [Lacunisphaera sp.]
MEIDHLSHWRKTATLPRFPALDHELNVDVAVVGGGIAGITSAYLLKQEGLSVALLERGRCGGIDTGHTTAHLTAVTDLRLAVVRERFGSPAEGTVWNAGTAAINRIAELVQARNIDCGFAWCPGYLHAASAAEDTAVFHRETEAARALGIVAEFQTSVPVFHVPGVIFPRQAMFHPLAYLANLVAAIPGRGSHVFENTEAQAMEKDPRQLRTPKGRISFKHLVIATHNPLIGLASLIGATLLQTKLALYSSYAIGARLPRERLPVALFWDTADPYHYLRVQEAADHTYVIYGGEDHKTGQADDTPARFARLEEKLRTFAPEAQVDARWSGQVIETNDGLPFIGMTPSKQFIATGFSGNGMTFGTLAGMMAVDAILERPNAWQDLFDPCRKVFHGGTWDYLKQNKDYPYHFVHDRLAKPDAQTIRDLAPGEGKVVKLKKRKVAAYRDEDGRVTMCSAVCTHLGGIVGWNAAEKTWDCPCHGARFHPDGRVLSGPAEEPLTRLSPATGLPLRPRRAVAAQ